MKMDCLLAGVGGQGTVLASRLIAQTAMEALGLAAHTSETIGMAQRGGSVTSQVRFGDSVASPIIQEGAAEILVSFDKVEALRNAGILTKGGTALVNDLYLVPVTVSSGQQQSPADLDGRIAKAFRKLILVDAMKIATDDVGNGRTMNMVLAGALSALCPFKEELWYDAMAQLLSGPKAKLLEINKKAFALGRAAATR